MIIQTRKELKDQQAIYQEITVPPHKKIL